MRKTTWIIGVVLGLLALPACERKDARTKAARDLSVPVTLAQATLAPFQRTVQVVGTLYGDQEATISAKVAGRVASVPKDVGDRAHPGEELLQIEQADYRLAQQQKTYAVQELLAKLALKELPSGDFDATTVPTVQRARLRAENARAKYDRGTQLHSQTPPLLSDQDFADLKTAWEVAQSDYAVELLTAQSLLTEARSRQADLEMAKEKLDSTTVRAPQSGNPGNDPSKPYAVVGRMVSVGEYVKEGTPVFRLVADDPVKLRASVPERYVSQVQVGQQASALVEAYTQEFTGQVQRINPQVDPTSRTFTVEIVIPNEKRLLKPGSFARAKILTRLDQNVVFVPRDAVVTFAGVSKVFTITDAKAVQHGVEVGQASQDLLEITKGLQGTEQLVIENAGKLADGVPVRLRSEGPQPTSRPTPPRASP
jgi:RND family efflux transporter MFP subunit